MALFLHILLILTGCPVQSRFLPEKIFPIPLIRYDMDESESSLSFLKIKIMYKY